MAFSGGKDSTVLLDLARKVHPDIVGVFSDTGLEFSAIRDFVKTKENIDIVKPKLRFDEVIKKFGYPIISKSVAQCAGTAQRNPTSTRAKYLKGEGTTIFGGGGKYYYLKDAPFKIGASCCDEMKKKPMLEYEKRTGCMPIIGTMTTESKGRKRMWLEQGCNAFEANHPSSRPISFWTEQDVLLYLKITGASYCSVYGDIVPLSEKHPDKLRLTGETRTGCVFCGFGCQLEKEPNRFQRLK